MTTLADRINDGMTTANADDLRELTERIEATEALLAGLRRSRDELLDSMEKRHEGNEDCLAVGPQAHDSHGRRLEEDATQPQRAFSDVF